MFTFSLSACRRSSLLSVPHGMFSRQGGISEPPFAGLNLSFSMGDDPAAVQQNRQRLKHFCKIRHLVSAVQVHGDRVSLVEDLTADCEYKETDALITRQLGVGLLIQQADCQGILLHDPCREVIAAVHNGWRGSVENIIQATIRAMQEYFRVNPRDLRAVISPSLGPCCAEFINYKKELPISFQRWRLKRNHFDFWAISRHQLSEAGLHNEHIETTGICTVCDKDFFPIAERLSERESLEQPVETAQLSHCQ
jgi:YfiH family protein